MRVVELQQLASQLGVKGISKMRKNDLIEAIRGAQGGAKKSAPARGSAPKITENVAPSAEASSPRNEPGRPEQQPKAQPSSEKQQGPTRNAGGSRGRQRSEEEAARAARAAEAACASVEEVSRDGSKRGDEGASKSDSRDSGGEGDRRGDNQRQDRDSRRQNDGGNSRGDSRQNQRNQDDDRRGGGRRRNRYRDRDRDRDRNKRRGRDQGEYEDIEINEDDVLVPVAGILDVRENYAFVRTTGYLPGPEDVYVPMGQIKRYGLRKGDAITGAVRQGREGENTGRQRGKFNALVRLADSSGARPLMVSKRTSALNLPRCRPVFSPSRPWQTAPVIASPLRRP